MRASVWWRCPFDADSHMMQVPTILLARAGACAPWICRAPQEGNVAHTSTSERLERLSFPE